MALTKPTIPAFQFTLPTNKRDDPKYKNVPMIVAPGKEDQYLADKAKYDAAQKKAAEKPKKSLQSKPRQNSPCKQTVMAGWICLPMQQV